MEIQLLTFVATLIFGLLFLGFCNGAPPREGASKRNTKRMYSRTEEQFIIDELRRTPGKNIQIYKPERWIEIAEAHRKMRESEPSIFPERTEAALSRHFQRVMLKSLGKVPLPDDLTERISALHKKTQGSSSKSAVPSQDENTTSGDARISQQPDAKRPMNQYTLAEDLFLMNVVKNHPLKHAPIYGHEMWNKAAEKLHQKRNLNPTAYPYERSGEALRKRYRRLSQKSKTRNTLSRIQQIARITEDENLVDVLDTKSARLRYSPAEDDLIIEQLLKPTCTNVHSLSMWKKIKDKHDRKVRSKTPGFQRERTVWSMMMRVRTMVEHKHPASRALKEKFPRSFSESHGSTSGVHHFSGESSSDQASENQESEDCDGMVEELLNTPCEVDFDMALAFDDEESKNYDSIIAELLNTPCEDDFDMAKDK